MSFSGSARGGAGGAAGLTGLVDSLLVVSDQKLNFDSTLRVLAAIGARRRAMLLSRFAGFEPAAIRMDDGELAEWLYKSGSYDINGRLRHGT